MKKILSLVLAMLMVFSVVPAVFADDAVTTTAATDSDYQDAIDFLNLIGLYKGGAGHEDADDVTRWQMALFVARALTGRIEDAYWKTNENNSGFYDVDEYLNGDESYIVGAVSYASNAGIINGYGDGTFDPNAQVTYRDALVMAVRALGYNYPTSGYPWSYVTKADELGLMDGITGVGQTEAASREVVAQILFNTVMAEVEGVTLAEKSFGVGTMTVMVTASNDVAFDGSSYVYRTDYIQFMEIDDQAEPIGAKYHIAAEKFGLDGRNAQNTAVGTNYKLVYKDNCVDVLAVEPLWTVFENYGDVKHDVELFSVEKAYVATATTENRNDDGNSYDIYPNDGIYQARFVTLGDGVRTKLVDFYTDLFNDQGEYGKDNMAGEPEIKFYGSAKVGELKTLGQVYYMDAQGYIYRKADLKIVAYYFEFFDMFYECTVGATGMYDYQPISAGLLKSITDDLIVKSNGLEQIKGLTSFLALKDSAYTKVIASDANDDGIYDRAMIRNYQFGYIDYNTNNGASFTVYTRDGLNSIKKVQTYNYQQKGYYLADSTNDYRLTGEATKRKDGYAIFYIDEINHELDVWVYIDKYTEGATTYWSTGYMLGFSVAANKVYIDDTEADRQDLGLGYTAAVKNCGLNLSPLVPFTNSYDTALSTPATTTNASLISMLLAYQHDYIEYVVVDGQLVYFENEADKLDYVVIDHFTEISEENGVVAHAYTTVTDSWEDITIAEFAGWNLASFDWETKWAEAIKESIFAGKPLPTAAELLAKFIPIEIGELYRVVYTNSDGAYNLRKVNVDLDLIDTVDRIHVENGKIHGFKGNTPVDMDTFVKYPNAQQSTKWMQAAAEHDWLILQASEAKDVDGNGLGYYDYTNIEAVYVVPGIIANTFIPNFDLYKISDDDFVLISDAANLSNFVESYKIGSHTTSFVYYSQSDLMGNDHNNEWADPWSFNVGDFHYYYRWMRDVATGSWTLVKIDTADYAEIVALLDGIDAKAAPANYAILRLTDGVLELADMDDDGVAAELPIVCMTYVADYYDDVNLWEEYDGAQGVKAATLIRIVETAGNYLDVHFCEMIQYVDTNDYFGIENITFVGVDQTTGLYRKMILTDYTSTHYLNLIDGKTVAKDDVLFGVDADLHIFWNNAEQKAFVYIDAAGYCANVGCKDHNCHN